MSDAAEPILEQRLGLVLRGVQRMADGLGSVDEKLPHLATAERLKALSDRVDEYRVRSRTELGQVGEVVTALAQAVDVVLREQQALVEEVRARGATSADTGAVDRLTEAVRGLRDDLAESHRILQEESRTAAARMVEEHASRSARLHEAVAATRQELLDRIDELRTSVAATPAPAPVERRDDAGVRASLDELRADLRRIQGDLATATGQVRTDVEAQQARLHDDVVAAVTARLAELQGPSGEPSDLLPGVLERLASIEARLIAPGVLTGIYDRLGGIEWRMGERLDPMPARLDGLEERIESLRQAPAGRAPADGRVAERLASLEAGLEHVAQRDDLRRGVDRVLGAVASAEQAVTIDLRAVDDRIGAIAEEVRVVRVLRDGLDALAAGVDGVRQLASRTATSQQMIEVTRDLSAVLAEIDSARSQVLRVEQSTTPVAAEVIAVGTEVDDLGRRIDELAGVIEDRMGDGSSEVSQRLRSISTAARQLGNGVLEDLREAPPVTARRRVKRGEFVVITGLSGAGRSQAANVLEDLGWFVIDNLPAALLDKVAELVRQPGSAIDQVGLVLGTRDVEELTAGLSHLRDAAERVRVLFLEAPDDVLVRRFEDTRRRHPFEDEGGLVAAIASERAALEPLKGEADVVVDTGDLNVHQLRARIEALFGHDTAGGGLQTSVMSFGYKHGLPLDVDLVLDCRFLPNPHWVEDLRPHTGKDADVREYVLGFAETGEFLERLDSLLELLLPAYVAEGKSYLTIAMGCTGGRHRSVVMASEVAALLRSRGFEPRVTHRDIDR